MTAFATAADMMNRYDVTTLGDICGDAGVRITPAQLPTNTKLLTALNSATGKIKANALRAGRYTVADLEGLTGESKAYLADLTCRVAFWYLWQRKPYTDDQQRHQLKADADDAIEEIRTGAECFEVQDAIDAGHPTISTVTRVEIENDWDLRVDEMRGRHFPRRRSYKRQ